MMLILIDCSIQQLKNMYHHFSLYLRLLLPTLGLAEGGLGILTGLGVLNSTITPHFTGIAFDSIAPELNFPVQKQKFSH